MRSPAGYPARNAVVAWNKKTKMPEMHVDMWRIADDDAEEEEGDSSEVKVEGLVERLDKRRNQAMEETGVRPNRRERLQQHRFISRNWASYL